MKVMLLATAGNVTNTAAVRATPAVERISSAEMIKQAAKASRTTAIVPLMAGILQMENRR